MNAFPLSAVVGQESLKLALILNALDPAIGGVLARGQKGSAKTTLARGLAAVLPGQAPFVELPVGASEESVVGTIDLRAALTTGERRFHPGLLAAAHGGVLYVDEVNLLADHVVDVLLDVAASGVNRVEREGISESHPSRFVLIGSMNPEEGELRPQLLDRFGLAVDISASTDPDDRALAVERRIAFDTDPAAFTEEWRQEEEDLKERLATLGAGRSTSWYAPSGDLVRVVTSMCATVGAEGLRADLVTCRATRALAMWEGRDTPTVDDVRRVAPLALSHRRRRSPTESPGIDPEELETALRQALGSSRRPSDAHGLCDSHDPDERTDTDEPRGSTGRVDTSRPASEVALERVAEIPTRAQLAPIPVEARRARSKGGATGRTGIAEGRTGRLVGDRIPSAQAGSLAPPGSVALGATVAAAALRRGAAQRPSASERPASGSAAADPVPVLAEGDIREAVREQKVANLVVIAVDASGSMGVRRRMEAAKGAVLSLVLDAYQRRDRIALVAFRGHAADVVLRPTGSVEIAKARLDNLATGGQTPLAAGITTALGIATAAWPGSGAYSPLIVVVSDGRATAGSGRRDPLTEAIEAAGLVRRRSISSLVADAEEGPVRLRLAYTLAEAMGARYVALDELSGPNLAREVRACMGTLRYAG